MDNKQALMISEAWRGPLGKWLSAKLLADATSARQTASALIPENIRDIYEQQHLLSRSNVLAELVIQIPSEINEEIKKSDKSEST